MVTLGFLRDWGDNLFDMIFSYNFNGFLIFEFKYDFYSIFVVETRKFYKEKFHSRGSLVAANF